MTKVSPGRYSEVCQLQPGRDGTEDDASVMIDTIVGVGVEAIMAPPLCPGTVVAFAMIEDYERLS